MRNGKKQIPINIQSGRGDYNHLQPCQSRRTQHSAAEDLQAQDSLFSDMRQIVINTSNGVSKTILAGMGISSFANIIPRNKTDQYYTGFLVICLNR